MKSVLFFLLFLFFVVTCFTQASTANLDNKTLQNNSVSFESNDKSALVHRPEFSEVLKSDVLLASRLNEKGDEQRKYSVLGVVLKPNPIRDILIIENTNEQLSKLVLFDLTGKQITQNNLAAGGQWRFEAAGLENGIYFLSVTVSKKQGLLKVFKI